MLAGNGQQQVLRADELVLELFRLVFGLVEDGAEARGETGLAFALGTRQLRQRPLHLGSDLIRIDLHLAQHVRHHAAALPHEGAEQVLRLDLRVVLAIGNCSAL